MAKFKKEIIELSKREIMLGFNIIYILLGLILFPFNDHYICQIINPADKFIKNSFKNYKIYMHEDLKNNPLMNEFKDNANLYNHGIPFLLIYKKNIIINIF